jgi:aconitate hydratase A / 2-methylisocitrate dehydratase
MSNVNSFGTRSTLSTGSGTVYMYSLLALEHRGFPGISRLPFSLKILLENLLRQEDNRFVKQADIEALANWDVKSRTPREISFMPARVLLQDFTGVPCVVDLAAMRDGIVRLGGDPNKVNPLQPVELVIDHSVQVDYFGQTNAFQLNAELEFARNKERYAFLRWGQNAFRNFRVVPPDTGIVHQVNLEYLARVVMTTDAPYGKVAFPDTLVGTDSHTTMVNGLGVVGWGVGGIEAEAAMLGQPSSMLIPPVLGVKLTGRLPEGTTATDLVLTITERLRKHGVVGKFVEFYGPGLEHLTLADRATLGNMCPEYGATIAIFPIDAMTVDYLRLSGRDAERIELVETYARAQGLYRDKNSPDPVYTETIDVDLSAIEPSLAGPKRPQDRVPLKGAKQGFAQALPGMMVAKQGGSAGGTAVAAPPQAAVEHGSVVIAAITSCTNTSNPSVMVGAGLVAKKAVEKGLARKPWVKTSLAPGSKVVTDYLKAAGLDKYLDQLGFNLVGYGCTTCIGNSGPLPDDVSAAIDADGLVVASVLSGNRNFEGRVQQQVRANYLASPPLVVAYALAGTMNLDLTTEPLGTGKDGKPVFLRDIWPSERELQETVLSAVKSEQFEKQYADVFNGDERWQKLDVPTGNVFAWQANSTYVRNPPFLEGVTLEPAPLQNITGARVLALLGDSITTDHISPAGSIKKDSPAGKYLIAHGVQPADFNSYGARRGNHEVMMRGTFANTRLRNQVAPGTEGGFTTYLAGPGGPGSNDVMAIYDAAMKYKEAGVPLLVLAGKEYGSGSSRDWAAKGTLLLGVKAVIAESFERIHRSNLVQMGVLPLQFQDGQNAASLGLNGREVYSVGGIANGLKAGAVLLVRAQGPGDGSAKITEFKAQVRIDTPEELAAYKHGGILPYVLRQLVQK